MKIHVVTVGLRMPDWVIQGWQEYAKRLPSDCSLNLIEVKPEPRNQGKTTAQIMQAEGKRILNSIPSNSFTIALDERGQDISTKKLNQNLEDWRASGNDVAFIIGGPDGLDEEIKRSANQRWRLSSMTMPHPLVRIILAEQIYRAWAIMTNHPYHRE